MTTEPLHITGHCYCGDIVFAVTLPADEQPLFALYCHCDSCRRAHAAPLYHVVCIEAARFTLTSGAEHLELYQKHPKAPVRAFCRTCGTRVLNRFPHWRPQGKEPLAFFPNLLDADIQANLPARFRPTRNYEAASSVLDQATLDLIFEHT